MIANVTSPKTNKMVSHVVKLISDSPASRVGGRIIPDYLPRLWVVKVYVPRGPATPVHAACRNAEENVNNGGTMA
jgi:hypothetical protein